MKGWPGGLYSKGMHDFILMEAEVGFRVAACQDSEDAMGAVFELHVRSMWFDDKGEDFGPPVSDWFAGLD